MAKDTFQKMKPILANRNISMKTKIRVIKKYVCTSTYQGDCFGTRTHDRKLSADINAGVQQLLYHRRPEGRRVVGDPRSSDGKEGNKQRS
ncbi:hypothetical protein PoB_001563200 [Plakobranchus ocellatus]|uniref:Uncharacterized protein n=1 Tax=Plakobranchus ocellatus TaxID=259542 RepID=A0AAV3Z3K0_9GAST|nr:hypothetical protein PoB_001563200 [Plakobranchus ocellatus]